MYFTQYGPFDSEIHLIQCLSLRLIPEQITIRRQTGVDVCGPLVDRLRMRLFRPGVGRKLEQPILGNCTYMFQVCNCQCKR